MSKWKVPYVNFPIVYKDMGEEIITEIRRVLAGGDLILRDDVASFEANFAKFLGMEYAIGVGNCTDALRLSLRCLGIGEGDEVITSSHTFLATLDAIVDVGATPILVDSGKDYNMDTSKLEAAVSNRTVAIMPVHLNGRVCNMDVVMGIAEEYKLLVIEDAAQALGATYKGRKAGTFGVASAFSFYPAKILGTVGDGGMVVTNDSVFDYLLRAMRDYGRVKGQEQVTGYGQNSRLDNVHAAILNLKLRSVPKWINRRREIASLYNNNLSIFYDSAKLQVHSEVGSDYYDVYQNYVIRADRRDELIQYLADNGVECLVHWKTPLHKQLSLRLEDYVLPETESISNEVVSLPMYPELTNEQVLYVCEKIREFYSG